MSLLVYVFNPPIDAAPSIHEDILYDEIYMIMIMIMTIITYDNNDNWKIIVYFIMPCYFDQFLIVPSRVMDITYEGTDIIVCIFIFILICMYY